MPQANLLILYAVMVLGSGVASDTAAEEAARIETIRTVKGSVVAIFGQTAAGGGSGVLISPDGFALTNFHVVSGIGVALKCGLDNGELYDAVLVGVDPVGDVALIQLLGRDDFPTAPLGDSDSLAVGQPVLAMGNPFLLATDFQPSVSLGIVSGLHRYQYPAQSKQGSLLEYTDCIQTDASINPGNSGGPLFNLAGEVIGINGRISLDKRGRVNVGVGYAISINQIKNFLDHLQGGMILDHASLGATVVTDAAGRTVVNEILNESDAFHQGLRIGDELVTFGVRVITSPNEFLNVLGIYPKGWRVPLIYRRDQQRHQIRPRLLGKHRDLQLQDIFNQEADQQGRPAPKTPLPKAVAAVYEARRGFANYYFNCQRRDALLEIVKGHNAGQATGKWTAQLQTQDGKAATVSIETSQAAWKQEGIQVAYPSEQPPPEGGADVAKLLMALEEWRRLMVDQQQWFSECTFGGGFRTDSGDTLLALETSRAGIDSQWLFDAEARQLRSMVLNTDDNQWIELDFQDYKPTESGSVLPWLIQLEIPGQAVREFRVTGWEVAP